MNNRERKYRIWDEDNKRMIYSFGNPFHDHLAIGLDGKLYSVGDSYNGAWCYEEDNMIVMEFIGKKDRNGKGIFEDDILSWKYFDNIQIGRVMYVDYSFVLIHENGDTWFLENMFEPTIAGNIYENPELLKENQK